MRHYLLCLNIFHISNVGNLNIDMRTYFSLFLLVTTQVIILGVNFSGYLDQSIIMA
jgi:hypothetical protein